MMDLRFLYLISVFISTIELVIYFETTSNKTNKNFLILCITTLVSNFGYAMSIYATSLEAAMSGTMVSYIGSMLTVYFMFVVVVEMCNRHIPIFVRIPVLILLVIFIIAIATTRETNLFFDNIYMDKIYSLTVIKFNTGKLMYIYVCYLIVLNVASLFTIVDSIIRKRRVSIVILWTLLFMMIFGTLAYLIPLILKFRINLMCFTYICMEAAFIVITIRANMYDLSLNLMNVYKSRGGYGYIAFDLKKHFLGCDELALRILPDLQIITIDSYIPENYAVLREKLHYNDENWKWENNINKDFQISLNDSSASCKIHSISYKEKTIGYLFELRDDTVEQNYINNINHYNKMLSKAVKEKTKKIYDIQDSIIKGMAMMVERRDNSTGGHILRTSDCVRIFVNELKNKNIFAWCTTEFCESIIKAAPMHDLGKIAVDDAILRKPGKFNNIEYEQMKKHAEEGANIVKEVLDATTDKMFKQMAINVAHYHHEKWNGEGYPEHLANSAIPVEARIMALADVFDALVSRRCYKDSKSFEEAFKIIEDDLGKHFDPELGQFFLECRPQLEEYYKTALKLDVF